MQHQSLNVGIETFLVFSLSEYRLVAFAFSNLVVNYKILYFLFCAQTTSRAATRRESPSRQRCAHSYFVECLHFVEIAVFQTACSQ